jgi:hypothetical protein
MAELAVTNVVDFLFFCKKDSSREEEDSFNIKRTGRQILCIFNSP